MGWFSKDIQTMDDLFVHQLQDIYYAEHQITKALPKMIEQATNRDLTQGLKNHLEETNKQIERLDQVFRKLGKQPSATDCPAIDGLIKESDHTAGEIEDKSVLDAAIVANAQAVEHYEIARYGMLIAIPQVLSSEQIAAARAILDAAEALLRSEGYYQPVLEDIVEGEETPVAVVQVTPGRRCRGGIGIHDEDRTHGA